MVFESDFETNANEECVPDQMFDEVIKLNKRKTKTNVYLEKTDLSNI